MVQFDQIAFPFLLHSCAIAFALLLPACAHDSVRSKISDRSPYNDESRRRATGTDAKRFDSEDRESAGKRTWKQIADSSEYKEGFFNQFYLISEGRLFLEVKQDLGEFLYVSSLARGVGSNALGLDRGRLGDRHIVHFRRSGSRLILVESNLNFRAEQGSPSERHAVEESFASAALWSFEIVAERDGNVLVDATSFITRDAQRVADRLGPSGTSSYIVDLSRSFVDPEACRSFPQNTVMQGGVTLIGKTQDPKVLRELNQAATRHDAITVYQRHEFAQLPKPGFESRPYHPQSGFFGTSFLDFSTPFDQPIAKLHMNRHRIEGRRLPDGRFEVTRPIRYFVDHAAPEPIRQALLEGASWWTDAFEVAGLPGAFEVAVLPENIDPLDLRYNVITWTHRATRGWSYGMSIVDPRTGEILKGHVTLGSQRIRQDYLIAEGILSPYATGDSTKSREVARNFSLARLRQLAAHEVGHTLGLLHNFAASSTESHSVMDYPFPKFIIRSGNTIDLSQAYEVGVGEWDKHAILMGYGAIPKNEDAYAWLEKKAQIAAKNGLKYLSDQNVIEGGAHPLAHRWDNGKDPIAELWHIAKVRRIALENLGVGAVRPDESLSALQTRLVPVYLLHRYQVEAAVKSIGGVDFSYESRPSSSVAVSTEIGQRSVDEKVQRQALRALLHTLSLEFLVLPDKLLRQLVARVPGFSEFLEVFTGRTADVFDPVEAASQSASITLALLLQPQRMERLDQQSSRDSRQLGPRDVLQKLLGETWRKKTSRGFPDAISRGVQNQVLLHLIELASNNQASSQTRGYAIEAIEFIAAIAKRRLASSSSHWQAHYRFALRQIEQMKQAKDPTWKPEQLPIPPGAPIGDACYHWLGGSLGNQENGMSKSL